MRRTAAAVLIVLAVSGCGDADDVAGPPPAAPTSAAASPSLPAAQRCENPQERYALHYPADWFVAQGSGIEPCTFFDVEPVVLEQGTEATQVAIRVDVREDVLLDQARRDTLGEGDMTAEDRSVGDWRAVRVTGTLTEEFLLPAGTHVTTWLVELDGRTMVMTADDHGAEDYEAAVAVLDEMVQSLETG